MRIKPDQVQEQRVESKFVVSEAVAEQIRAAASRHLVPDPHSLGCPGAGYSVHSLYLDSADLDSYWATVHRKDGRFKLRIRFYDDDATRPVYVEMKQRTGPTTLKQRCPVARNELADILSGRQVAGGWRGRWNPKHLAALKSVIGKLTLLEAAPKLHIAYQREAYVSGWDNSVRLTLDRDIRSEPAKGFRLSTTMRQPRKLCESSVVLEFKVIGPEPDWFRRLVHRLHLRPESFAKYVAAVEKHGLDAVAPSRASEVAQGPGRSLEFEGGRIGDSALPCDTSCPR